MFKFWKVFFCKTSRDEHIETRVNDVYTQLFSETPVIFTELEKVQILNDVRRRLSENFKNKRSECISKITDCKQTLKELDVAEGYLN